MQRSILNTQRSLFNRREPPFLNTQGSISPRKGVEVSLNKQPPSFPPQNVFWELKPLPSPNRYYSPRGVSYTKSQEIRGVADFEGVIQVKSHYIFLNGSLF